MSNSRPRRPPGVARFAIVTRRRTLLALSAAAAVALAAGCGDGSSSTSTASDSQPSGDYPAAGISFAPPKGYSVAAGKGRLVATVQAGQATVAIWRYPRKERLPRSKDELKAARDALVKAAAKADATFAVIKTAPTEIAGEPAVQIRARETIAGKPRTVRSSHIYAYGAELVVDAYAEHDRFREVDANVFRPLLRSLKVSAPGA
jgi:hypothetical protein